jgi:hypothetical protein
VKKETEKQIGFHICVLLMHTVQRTHDKEKVSAQTSEKELKLAPATGM